MAERFLPGILLRVLDPVQAAIEMEVAGLAGVLREGEVLLDAGAGEARHRRYFRTGRYVALDRGHGEPAWDYSNLDVVGDLELLPMRPSSVSHIVCMVVLEHTRRPATVLSEFSRVLRPGGQLRMVVPFHWEEHQAPNDYFRFTRYGVKLLFEGLPFTVDSVEPIGGFFGVCARRSIDLLGFLQRGWRWILFVPLAPVFGLLLPLLLQLLDGVDVEKRYSLAFRVRATRRSGAGE